MKKKDHRPYVEVETSIRIRFGEVDSMRIVWHGNYLKYFEDAREILGEKLGLSYLEIYSQGYVTPIVKSGIEHKAPLAYGTNTLIRIRLIDDPAAKIIHRYTIFDQDNGVVAAEGETIQVFLDTKNELQLVVPEFYQAWKDKQNWIKP